MLEFIYESGFWTVIMVICIIMLYAEARENNKIVKMKETYSTVSELVEFRSCSHPCISTSCINCVVNFLNRPLHMVYK